MFWSGHNSGTSFYPGFPAGQCTNDKMLNAVGHGADGISEELVYVALAHWQMSWSEHTYKPKRANRQHCSCDLKGQFTANLKIHIFFPLTCVWSYTYSCYSKPHELTFVLTWLLLFNLQDHFDVNKVNMPCSLHISRCYKVKVYFNPICSRQNWSVVHCQASDAFDQHTGNICYVCTTVFFWKQLHF